jgi:hypothetical protein
MCMEQTSLLMSATASTLPGVEAFFPQSGLCVV